MLSLSKKDIDQLIKHAKAELPNEACGLIAGKDNIAEIIYLMLNTDESRESYFMDPAEQLRVMKEIRNNNLEMIAIYHSHPETRAYPSEHDVRLALYPDVSYIIISLQDENNPEIKSFRIIDGKIEEESLA